MPRGFNEEVFLESLRVKAHGQTRDNPVKSLSGKCQIKLGSWQGLVGKSVLIRYTGQGEFLLVFLVFQKNTRWQPQKTLLD